MDPVVSVKTAGKICSLVVVIVPLDCEPLVPIFQEMRAGDPTERH